MDLWIPRVDVLLDPHDAVDFLVETLGRTSQTAFLSTQRRGLPAQRQSLAPLEVHEEDIKVLHLLPLSLRQDMNQEALFRG